MCDYQLNSENINLIFICKVASLDVVAVVVQLTPDVAHNVVITFTFDVVVVVVDIFISSLVELILAAGVVLGVVVVVAEVRIAVVVVVVIPTLDVVVIIPSPVVVIPSPIVIPSLDVRVVVTRIIFSLALIDVLKVILNVVITAEPTLTPVEYIMH